MMNRFSKINRLDDRATRRYIAKEREKNSIINSGSFSQTRGIIYSLVLTFMLWWVPIVGPATAGYISGRRSGEGIKGIIASMVTIAAILIFTFALLPFKSGPLAYAATYFSSGILVLSSSKLAAASNILTDMYTAYGLFLTFAVIFPGSIVELLTFSYVGGSVTSLRNREIVASESYNKNFRLNAYRDSRNRPSVKVHTRGITPFQTNESGVDEDGGVPYTSLD